MRSCAKKLILFIYGNVWRGLGNLSMGFFFGVGQATSRMARARKRGGNQRRSLRWQPNE